VTLTQPERDADGRYLIKGRPFARVTEILRVFQDHKTIHRWEQRKLVQQLIMHPGMIGTSLDLDDIDAVIAATLRDGTIDTPARIGTQIHEQTALHDTGQPITRWTEVVDTYTAGLAERHITIMSDLVERTVCYPDDDIAGTFDRIVEWEGRLVVADIKTGRWLNWLSIAAQLAAYAHAPFMLAPNGELEDTPAVSLDTGLVFQLPANGAPMTVWEVDLWEGFRAWQLAVELHDLSGVLVCANEVEA